MKRGESRRVPALERELPRWIGGGLVLGTAAAVLFFETRRRPLRARREPKARRDVRNLAVGAAAALAIRVFEQPLVSRLARRVARERSGLVPRLGLPAWLELPLAILLLDYTLYVWHVLTHRVPFLWRFHRVHHADLDLDASTALRFHFGEMLLSVPWRAAQVVLIGATPLALSTWQSLTLAAILFHHSEIRMPWSVERRLARVLMTPRLHGIHHSIVRDETDSNWGTIFSLPDRVHGTGRFDLARAQVDVGVPEYRDPSELGLGELLRMPFGRQRRWPPSDRSRPSGSRIDPRGEQSGSPMAEARRRG